MATVAPDLALRPSANMLGRAWRWMRVNLLGSPLNIVLTVAMLAVFWFTLAPLVRWAVIDATIAGDSKAGCTGAGACWTFIKVRFPMFFYGRYPVDERWRVDLAALLLAVFAVPAMLDKLRHRWIAVLALVAVYPVIAGILLRGGIIGLRSVETALWGGLMLNAVLTFLAVAGSLPFGILLALGRRSKFPVVRIFSICFIELWRGVPLLTALFMGMVMLPLFLPNGVTVDNLVRAAVALTLFTSAYMAEVVRGGLQAIPLGQFDGAKALGLGFWQMQALIVLPQALRIVVPNIVNTVIDLFKDTTLVVIVSLFDMLGVVNQSLKDSAWLGMAKEGYAFAALVFFVCCWSMSLYSRRLERRLGVEQPGRH
ncbi:MAG: amino acid ABC transporter permease [Alphaproteobacteria bacterium]|nr:amino acid ABC transporter permease [Alphaproteobacteria bacterium]